MISETFNFGGTLPLILVVLTNLTDFHHQSIENNRKIKNLLLLDTKGKLIMKMEKFRKNDEHLNKIINGMIKKKN